jgi:hypothetical protein
MILLLLAIGYLPLTCIGALAVRALMGASPELTRSECALYGAVIGPTMVMDVVFLLANLGVPIGTGAFLAAIVILLLPLALLHRKRMRSIARALATLPAQTGVRTRNWFFTAHLHPVRIACLLIGLWIVVKIVAGTTVLLTDPAYNDDVFNNWNFRAKVLLHEQTLVLDLPGDNRQDIGVSAYPPTVPLLRGYLATVGGGWNDGVIALTAPLSYLLILGLLYTTLRRSTGTAWALLGLYIGSSLPLLLMHGITPYADLFVALHILVALLPLFHALETTNSASRSSWLRVGALGAALLPMTKNEALLIHLPPILLLSMGVILWSVRGKVSDIRSALRSILWYGALLLAVLGPWLAYKYAYGLAFGNAKEIDTALAWQEGALRSLFITWVLEANFLLLPGLLAALLWLRQRRGFGSPAMILSLFVLVVTFGLIGIFTLTGLSTEALRQTGSARGIIQIVPVMVILATLLLQDWWNSIHAS